jgi:EAL domain-containing protein (putative c-di-GMP-specific phosphodiesterase class I)
VQLTAVVGYALLARAAPDGGPAARWIGPALFGVVLAVTVTTTVTAWRSAPTGSTERLGWLLLAAAHLGIGVVVLATIAAAGSGPRSWPSIAYVSYDVPVLIAAWLLVRARAPAWSPRMWWDTLVVGFGAGAVVSAALWLFRPEGGYAASGGSLGNLSPIVDAVLVVAILSVATLSGSPVGRAPWWIFAGLSTIAATDAMYLMFDLWPTPARPSLLDLGWLSGYVLIGWSACADRVAAPDPDRRRRPTGMLWSTLLPWTFTTLALVVLLAAAADEDVPRLSVLLALSGVATMLFRAAVGHPAVALVRRYEDIDEMTGLPGRRTVSRVLAGDEADADTGEPWPEWTDRVALLVVDLDDPVTTEGVPEDASRTRNLAEASIRMRDVVRDGQLLARLDERTYAVVLPGAGTPPAHRVASALYDRLRELSDRSAGDRTVRMTAPRVNIGIATCVLDRGNPTDLLRQAGLAVARARATGTGIEFYDPERDPLDESLVQRSHELRAALEHGQVEVFLQPQIRLSDGRVVGAEALARWRHPQDGVLLPESFLPLAARTGLMRPMAAVVLDRALAACARWWPQGHRVTVSVNLTADDLKDPGLDAALREGLDRYGLPGAALCVEITENVLVDDAAQISRLLRRWRELGVSVALDDFGTGYSSLAYLHELPVDEVKLDRGFAARLSDRRAAVVVRHAVSLAHALRLRVVAEGIEDQGKARQLADNGCDIGQGLYFGDATDLPSFLTRLGRPGRR